jgi:hypothetical protein
MTPHCCVGFLHALLKALLRQRKSPFHHLELLSRNGAPGQLFDPLGINPPASNKRRKRNQSISDRKPREGARRHVATEGFCVARVAGSGSCCPQCAQLAQVGSMGLSHFEHVGCSKVPQRGQNGNPAFSRCPQLGHGFGRGSRRMKYKIIPIPFGMKMARSVHITYRICRRFASP